jgi:RNA polymerase sigma-70 factor (ECF subfamily)
VEEARRGDRTAFDELVRRTYVDTYTLAVRLTGNEEDARDVVQEAYLRAWKGIGRFRGDSQFTTWLYRITANAAITHLRRRGRFGDLLDDPGDVVEVPDQPSADPVDRDEIHRALFALPVAQRTVLVMRDAYGFSIAEIAEELGLSEGAVKVRIHRARRRLKDLVYGPTEVPGHEAVQKHLPELAEERGRG